MKPTLVAWCAGCRVALPVEDAGVRCSFGDPDCKRRLRKRRVWVCDRCDPDCDTYLSRAAYEADQREHEREG